MQRLAAFIIAAILPLLGLAACAAAPGRGSDVPLLETTWVLQRIGESPVELEGDEASPWIALEEGGAIRGYTGCNMLRGGYTLAGEAFSVGPLATTRRFCAEKSNDVEMRVLLALQAAAKLTLRDGTLRIGEGENELLLTPEEPAGVAGAS